MNHIPNSLQHKNTHILNDRLSVLFLINIFLQIALISLGLFTDIFGDAARYAAISKEMLANKAFFAVSYHQGEAYLQKPPVLFWWTTLSYALFGVSNLTFKLPSILISLSACYALFQFTKKYYGRNTALWAVIIHTSSISFIFYHNDIHTDTTLAAYVMWAIYAFDKYHDTGSKKGLALFGFMLFMAFMTKGPLGIIFPSLLIGGHLLMKGELRLLKWKELFFTGITILVFCAAYFHYLYKAFGLDGLLFFFWKNNTGRISGEIQRNNSQLWFYFLNLLWLYLPWSVFTYQGYYFRLKELYQQKFKLKIAEEGYTLGGVFVYVLIISLAQSKVPHYLFIATPFLSVISAYAANRWWERQEKNRLLNAILIFFIVIMSIMAIGVTTMLTNSYSYLAIILLGGLFSLLGYLLYKKIHVAYLLLLASAAMAISIHLAFLPKITQNHAAYKVSQYLKEERIEEVWLYRKNPDELFYYSESDFKKLEDINQLQSISEVTYIYTDEEGYKTLKEAYVFVSEKEFQHQKPTRPKWLFRPQKYEQKRFLIKVDVR